jgi:hypothetical protein
LSASSGELRAREEKRAAMRMEKCILKVVLVLVCCVWKMRSDDDGAIDIKQCPFYIYSNLS